MSGRIAIPLAGLVLLAGAVVPAAGSPRAARLVPKTLLTEKGRIHAFAQDAGTFGWIGPSYAVHVRRFGAKRGSVVGSALSEYKSTTWPLALAGTQALWTSYSAGNFIYTSVHTGSPTMRDHAVDTTAYEPGPADGSWLSGVAGHGSTLVFGATSQRCDVEWNCRRLDVSGAVKRVDTEAHDLSGLPPSFLLATSSNRIAVVPAKTPRLYPDIGPPRAAEYAPVEIYDAAGHLISSMVPPGTPRAIALSWPKLAVLVEFVDGSRQIQLYDARTGGYWFAGGEGVFTPVPVTVTRVAVGAPGAVYSVGSGIYLLQRQKPQLVWRAGGTPIGLSIEGRRIAWAENIHGRGRVRVLTLPG